MRKSKEEIIHELGESFNSLSATCLAVREEDFNISKQNKWTPGENFQHLITATKMTGMAFSLPKVLHVALYGKSGRTSHGYTKIVDNYAKKLEGGAKASGAYIPKKTDYKRDELSNKLKNEGSKLISSIQRKWTEDQLDHYVIKHPILELLTLRELAYFTLYHNEHHLNTVRSLYMQAPR